MLSHFDLLYKVRYADPKRFRTNQRDLDEYMAESLLSGTKNSQTELASAKSRASLKTTVGGHLKDKDLYDCYKGILLESDIADI